MADNSKYKPLNWGGQREAIRGLLDITRKPYDANDPLYSADLYTGQNSIAPRVPVDLANYLGANPISELGFISDVAGDAGPLARLGAEYSMRNPQGNVIAPDYPMTVADIDGRPSSSRDKQLKGMVTDVMLGDKKKPMLGLFEPGYGSEFGIFGHEATHVGQNVIDGLRPGKVGSMYPEEVAAIGDIFSRYGKGNETGFTHKDIMDGAARHQFDYINPRQVSNLITGTTLPTPLKDEFLEWEAIKAEKNKYDQLATKVLKDGYGIDTRSFTEKMDPLKNIK